MKSLTQLISETAGKYQIIRTGIQKGMLDEPVRTNIYDPDEAQKELERFESKYGKYSKDGRRKFRISKVRMNFEVQTFSDFSDLARFKNKERQPAQQSNTNPVIAILEKGNETFTILKDRSLLKNGKDIGKIPASMNINEFIASCKQRGFKRVQFEQKKFHRFQQGSGVYTCISCRKRTRDIGDDSASVQLCSNCYEKAGLENQHNDSGHSTPIKGCPLCHS